jgi:hypothetical protein
MRRIDRRSLAALAGLATLQGGAYLLYRVVSSRRSAPTSASFAYERTANISVGEATFEKADGGLLSLSDHPRRPTVLHFWATWCAPCRTELPSLLAGFGGGSAESSPRLVLASLDENWKTLRHYFGGAVPEAVVRDHGGVGRRLGVANLPETLLLLAQGEVAARVRGARNWESADARHAVAALIGGKA